MSNVTFATLGPEGLQTVRVLPLEAVMRCPHVILLPSHYREDGSCRCNEPDYPEMQKAGYIWDPETKQWESPLCA